MTLPQVERGTHTKRDTSVAWFFVGIQFVLLGVMVFAPRDAGWVPTDVMRSVGAAFMAIGVILGAWAFLYLGRGLTPSPLPNGATDLVTRGPYRAVRHPIYTSVMLLGIGIVIRAGSWSVAIAFGALVVLFSIKSRWEEMHLADSFPGYERYMHTTGRFLPKITR